MLCGHGGEGGEAYYVEISTKGLVVATGYWMMANPLQRIVADLRAQTLEIEPHGLKAAPRGYARDHPRVELLRHMSMAAMRTFPPAGWLATGAAAERVVDVWRTARPLNDWLAAHVGPSTEPPQLR